MNSRPGVTLVEVLVAAVLLAVGISGTVNALAVSARLRLDADAREAIAAVMTDRLAWFEARGCIAGDSAGTVLLDAGATAEWRVTREGNARVLELRGHRRLATGGGRQPLRVGLTCE